MFDSNAYEPDWMEFHSPIWAGLKHGYVNGAGLSSTGPERPDRPVCTFSVRNDEGWWLIVGEDAAILVSHSNVRFVVYRAKRAATAETQDDHKGKVLGEVLRDTEQRTHAIDATVSPIDFTNIPKRRGRPPKQPWPNR